VRAPIFVKGGIVHGPKPRDFSLDFPKKMRRKALFSALSAKLLDEEIRILSGLEKIEPKTKIFASALLKLLPDAKKRRLLLVTPDNFASAHKATRNIQGVERTSPARLNALDVLRNKHLFSCQRSTKRDGESFFEQELIWIKI
jgi:Ribosomal protein L4